MDDRGPLAGAVVAAGVPLAEWAWGQSYRAPLPRVLTLSMVAAAKFSAELRFRTLAVVRCSPAITWWECTNSRSGSRCRRCA